MANPNIVAVTNILGGNLGWNLSATATNFNDSCCRKNCKDK